MGRKKIRPALSPEARENQLIALAVDHHEVIQNKENRYIIPIYRVELIPKVRWNECIR